MHMIAARHTDTHTHTHFKTHARSQHYQDESSPHSGNLKVQTSTPAFPTSLPNQSVEEIGP